MEIHNSNTNNGIGAVGMLGVLFVAFKLLGIINWSWWWITMPFWIGGALVLVILLTAITYYLIGKKPKTKI